MPTLLHLPTKPQCIQVTLPQIMPRILTTSPTSAGTTLSNPPSWASITMTASQLHPCPLICSPPRSPGQPQKPESGRATHPMAASSDSKVLTVDLVTFAACPPFSICQIPYSSWSLKSPRTFAFAVFSSPQIPKGSLLQRGRFLLKGLPCSALPVSSSPSPTCVYSSTAHLEFQHHEAQGHVLQCPGK